MLDTRLELRAKYAVVGSNSLYIYKNINIWISSLYIWKVLDTEGEGINLAINLGEG